MALSGFEISLIASFAAGLNGIYLFIYLFS